MDDAKVKGSLKDGCTDRIGVTVRKSALSGLGLATSGGEGLGLCEWHGM